MTTLITAAKETSGPMNPNYGGLDDLLNCLFYTYPINPCAGPSWLTGAFDFVLLFSVAV